VSPWEITEDFKADAVRLYRVGGQSTSEVARRLDLTERSLWAWVKQAEIDAGKGRPEALTTVEREELGELRRRVKRRQRAAHALVDRLHKPDRIRIAVDVEAGSSVIKLSTEAGEAHLDSPSGAGNIREFS
jgi:transposase-like protein